jgi:hypothetical protein
MEARLTRREQSQGMFFRVCMDELSVANMLGGFHMISCALEERCTHLLHFSQCAYNRMFAVVSDLMRTLAFGMGRKYHRSTKRRIASWWDQVDSKSLSSRL